MKYLVLIILILLFMIIFSNKEPFNIYDKNLMDEAGELNNILENYKIKNFDRNLSFHTLNSTILKHKDRLSNLNFLNI